MKSNKKGIMKIAKVFSFLSVMAAFSITSVYAATFSYTLTYDAANRVTRVIAGGTNQTDYTWQANGQLLTRTTAGNRLAGDLNSNGAVDLADAIIATQIITSTTTSTINPASDVNKDGKLGLSETIYVLRKLAE